MMRLGWVVLSLVVVSSGGLASAEPAGFGAPLKPEPVLLKKERVGSLLKMIPELARATAQYQGTFLSQLGSSADPASLPSIPEAEMKRLEKIYAKHGFTLEGFIGELSVMVATYFALDKDAFAAMLPSEEKPEIKAMLADPKLSPEHKAQIRARIKHARENQDQLRQHLTSQTNEANMAVLKPLLPQVRAVFKEVQGALRAARDQSPKKPR